MGEHAVGKIGDDLNFGAAGFDIHQPQFGQGQGIPAGDQPVEKLRGIAAAAARTTLPVRRWSGWAS